MFKHPCFKVKLHNTFRAHYNLPPFMLFIRLHTTERRTGNLWWHKSNNWRHRTLWVVLIHAEGMSYSCECSGSGSTSFSPQGVPEEGVGSVSAMLDLFYPPQCHNHCLKGLYTKTSTLFTTLNLSSFTYGNDQVSQVQRDLQIITLLQPFRSTVSWL